MQRLSMIALTAFAVLALSGAGFTNKPATPSIPNPNPAGKTAFATSYYFYSTIDGSYNDYATISQEIYEMEIYWGCPVDQNGFDGTLIEEGYFSQNTNMPVMVWLYGHFDQ
jgi:hypothetical protein